MSYTKDRLEASKKNIAAGYLEKASKRLAGNKRCEISIDVSELDMRRGHLNDWFNHQARVVGDCQNCKGLRIDEHDDFNRRKRVYRLSCSRSKPNSVLKCDDGVEVYVNQDMRVESLLRLSTSSSERANDWASLMMEPRALGGFHAEYMIIDELSEMTKNVIMTDYPLRDSRAKPVSKDQPQTQEADTW